MDIYENDKKLTLDGIETDFEKTVGKLKGVDTELISAIKNLVLVTADKAFDYGYDIGYKNGVECSRTNFNLSDS
jgi:hypothetical protein